MRISLQKGGIDNYVLQTGRETLGWKGMEIRCQVRDALKNNNPNPAPTVKEAKTPSPSRVLRYTRRMAAKALGFTGLASYVSLSELISLLNLELPVRRRRYNI